MQSAHVFCLTNTILHADEHFNFSHGEAPYLEFPILQNATVYDGGRPGADRVVIGSIAEDYSSAVYCACITHDGQKKEGFSECKGKWIPRTGGAKVGCCVLTRRVL